MSSVCGGVILAENGMDKETTVVGERWLDRFLRSLRHKARVIGRIAFALDGQRALATDLLEFKIHLSRYQVKSCFKVDDEDVWSDEENGLAMGLAHVGKFICRENRRKSNFIQNGSRVWVAVVGGVNTLGPNIPPFVMPAGENHLMGYYTDAE